MNSVTDYIDAIIAFSLLACIIVLFCMFLLLVSQCAYAILTVTFVHCAQTAEDTDTISFAHDSPMSLPFYHIVFLFGLHRSISCFPDFAEK